MVEALISEVETTNRSWSDLPPELLSLIQSHLVLIRDRYAFKVVCKSWNMITCVRVPRPLPPPIDSPYHDSPCLMISQRNSRTWKIFHAVYNDFYYMDFPELMDAEIRFSNYGWLLLSRGNTLFFFNPFTRTKMEVPSTTSPFISMSFSSPPTTSNCLVLGISSIYFGLLQYGDREREWEEYTYVNIEFGFYVSRCPPVFRKGVFYCMDRTGNICVFNPYSFNPYNRGSYGYYPKYGKFYQQCHMAEVEGEIWGMFVGNCDRRIALLKLNLTLLRWESLGDLGDKCFYVGHNGSFAETGISTGMANSIYFNRFYGESGILLSRNDNKYHSFNCNFINYLPYGLTETGYNSAWIKPSFS